MDASQNGDELSPTIAARVFRAVANVLVAIVAVLMGCSLLGFLARLWWPLELMCHFQVQYAVFLMVAAMLLTVCRRWRWAAAGGAVALVNAAVILPYLVAAAPTTPEHAETMRIVLMNVLASNRNTPCVLDAVDQLSPDVIVFVEVTPRWAKELGGLKGDYPYHRVVPERHGAGVAVYSRLPLEDVQAETIGGTEVPAITANINTSGGRFSLVAAHPISPIGPTRAAQRNRQLAALATLAGKEPNPVLLVGDLNVTPWSPHFRDVLRVGKLRDSRIGFGILPTWPQLTRWSLLQIPIDHCLVGEDVGVAEFSLGPAIGSDHFPIVVDCYVAKDNSP